MNNEESAQLNHFLTNKPFFSIAAPFLSHSPLSLSLSLSLDTVSKTVVPGRKFSHFPDSKYQLINQYFNQSVYLKEKNNRDKIKRGKMKNKFN